MRGKIHRAAVIGAGTMGSGIAALLVGVGIETILLDIPVAGTRHGDAPYKRNALVLEALKRLKTARPMQPFSSADVDLIHVGNLEDNLNLLGGVDWVVEAVVEKLAVKQALIENLRRVIRPDAIVSTNTSGIPLKAIAAEQPVEFKRRFIGTHFFNPPRYLRLLEIIAHEETDPAIVRFMLDFGADVLGKGTVLCKDTPNFIANRISSFGGSFVRNYMLDHGLGIEEVDALTGPLIGRPKTATFRLQDLVGLDTSRFVVENLYAAVVDDPFREVLNHPKTNALAERMLAEGRLGNKTGQGFYKQVKGAGGARAFWVLNLDTFEYEAPGTVVFDSVEKHKGVKDTGERIRLLISEADRAGMFLFNVFAFDLTYASWRIPEVSDSLMDLDNAVKWGFNREMGPFEVWDALGVREALARFEAAGYGAAGWVKAMVEGGHETFYQRDAGGLVVGYYSPQVVGYVPAAQDGREIKAAGLLAGGKVLDRNEGAAVLDMGDGVLLLAFEGKHNTIDHRVIEMTWRALDLLERGFAALVIGNDGERFSIGANLSGSVLSGPGGVEGLLKALQDVLMAVRYAPKPVVTAPFGMTLGGGAEYMMAGARVAAHAELNAGLVEANVGLVPAGGGCKELLRRLVNPVMESSANADAMPHVRRIFEMLLYAKTSSSAKEAREMGFLTASDGVVMNRARLLGEAKRAALTLARDYRPPAPVKIWAGGRDARAALLLAAENLANSGAISPYDKVIAGELAYILSGGGLSEPQWVSEQFILNLERAAFMRLLMEPKTLERVAHMLQYNQPLKN